MAKASKKPLTTIWPARAFVLEGDRSYILARLVSFTGAGFAGRAGYLGQLALEMYLKAITVEHDGTYLAVHKLIDLADRCATFDSSFTDTELLDGLKLFDSFDQVGRYGPIAHFDPNAIETPELRVRGVVGWLPEHLTTLDQLVFTIRGKISDKGNDSLRAIQTNDKTHLFVAEWKFPVLLRSVLTSNNRNFQ